MPTIFEQLEHAHDTLLSRLRQYEAYDEGHRFSWPNYVFRSSTFRRAHLDIIDARDTNRLYMMHLTVFPHVNDPSPIFGFDLIAGPTKVTGAFHDLSPVADGTSLDTWFAARAAQQQWSKERQLPEWARQIFSPSMVAAGNIQDPDELARLINFVLSNLMYYLDSIGKTGLNDYTERQNHYCHWQKQNPHTPRVMAALGFEPEVVHDFIHKCLFPEL